jgi:hypothetical protein
MNATDDIKTDSGEREESLYVGYCGDHLVACWGSDPYLVTRRLLALRANPPKAKGMLSRLLWLLEMVRLSPCRHSCPAVGPSLRIPALETPDSVYAEDRAPHEGLSRRLQSQEPVKSSTTEASKGTSDFLERNWIACQLESLVTLLRSPASVESRAVRMRFSACSGVMSGCSVKGESKA